MYNWEGYWLERQNNWITIPGQSRNTTNPQFEKLCFPPFLLCDVSVFFQNGLVTGLQANILELPGTDLPVVVQVRQLVGQPLHVVGLQASHVPQHVVVSGAHCALAYGLRDEEEVVPGKHNTQTLFITHWEITRTQHIILTVHTSDGCVFILVQQVACLSVTVIIAM